MGGVINSVLKSGSNEFHGSVFRTGRPTGCPRTRPDHHRGPGRSATSACRLRHQHRRGGRRPDHQGPAVLLGRLRAALPRHARVPADLPCSFTIRRRWAPRGREPATRSRSKHLLAGARPRVRVRPATTPPRWTWSPSRAPPDAGRDGQPELQRADAAFNNVEFISNPAWAQEKLTKSNSGLRRALDVEAVRQPLEIDARAGIHTEYLYDRSPNAAQRAQPAGLLRRQPVGPRGRPGCADRDLSALPRRRLPHGRVRPDSRSTTAGAGWLISSRPTCSRPAATTSLPFGWHPVRDVRPGALVFGPARGARHPLATRRRGFQHLLVLHAAAGQQPSDFEPGRHRARFPTTDLLTRPSTRTTSRRASRAGSTRSSSRRTTARRAAQPDGQRRRAPGAPEDVRLPHGNAFLDATNISPRVGAMLDPFSDGRSKLSVFYGRYYEAIPLNVASRYFGGEGILVRNNVPSQRLRNRSPYSWNGSGASGRTAAPRLNRRWRQRRRQTDNAAGGTSCCNNGQNYPVQSDLQGRNTTTRSSRPPSADHRGPDRAPRLPAPLAGPDHRGRRRPTVADVRARDPGHVPASALAEARPYREQTAKAADQRAMMPDLGRSGRSACVGRGGRRPESGTLEGLAAAPKPERTYDAIGVGEQAVLEELADARVVHLLRLIGNYDASTSGAELLRAQRQQRLRHARPVRQPEWPRSNDRSAPGATSTASTPDRRAAP